MRKFDHQIFGCRLDQPLQVFDFESRVLELDVHRHLHSASLVDPVLESSEQGFMAHPVVVIGQSWNLFFFLH